MNKTIFVVTYVVGLDLDVCHSNVDSCECCLTLLAAENSNLKLPKEFNQVFGGDLLLQDPIEQNQLFFNGTVESISIHR